MTVTTSNFDHRKRGFSLLELIIVLAVVGILLTGLFQLTSASTRQINSQIMAQQLQQWIKGYKAYVYARTDSVGAKFLGYGANCAAGADLLFNVGDTKPITDNVQCFRQGNLPQSAPNGGTYRVYMTRLADVAGKGSYQLSATVFGGNLFDDATSGSTAAYVGAEGATFFPAGVDSDDGSTACDESGATIRGAFGATCAAPPGGTAYSNYAPSTLSYISMLDVGTDVSNYLWRVTGPNGEYNKMTVDQGMKAGINLTWENAAHTPGAGDGDISMAGGSLTGVRHIDMGSSLAVIGIDTRGGYVQTQGGDLLTGGGEIDTTDGNITSSGTVHGDQVTGAEGHFDSLYAQQFLYTSDARLKKNVQTLPDALAKIMALRGVSFDWKNTGQSEIGVIAQEVQQVYPQAVATTVVDGQERLAVQEGNLVAPLIEAVKALKLQNDGLQAQLDALRQGLKNQKDRR